MSPFWLYQVRQVMIVNWSGLRCIHLGPLSCCSPSRQSFIMRNFGHISCRGKKERLFPIQRQKNFVKTIGATLTITRKRKKRPEQKRSKTKIRQKFGAKNSSSVFSSKPIFEPIRSQWQFFRLSTPQWIFYLFSSCFIPHI